MCTKNYFENNIKNEADSDPLLVGVCGWQKMTLVRFSVWFCKKNLGFQFGFTKLTVALVFLVWLGLQSSVNVDDIFHLRLHGMML